GLEEPEGLGRAYAARAVGDDGLARRDARGGELLLRRGLLELAGAVEQIAPHDVARARHVAAARLAVRRRTLPLLLGAHVEQDRLAGARRRGHLVAERALARA